MEITAYQALQVQENALPEVIDAAWRALAKKFHPDCNPGVDPQIITVINQAHDMLAPDKRKQYDAALRHQRALQQQPAAVFWGMSVWTTSTSCSTGSY